MYVQACHLTYIKHACDNIVYVLECICRRVRPCSSDHPSHEPETACRAAQVNFSSGQAPLSGSPMWFHLDHQGLQLQSADSLSGHRAGAVQGEGPTDCICSRLSNSHHGTHLIACNRCLAASLVPDCPE